MSGSFEIEAPQTLEGWYVLHDIYRLDWPRWNALPAGERDRLAGEAQQWLSGLIGGDEGGDSALFSVLGHKGDVMFLHYREGPEQLDGVVKGLRRREFSAFLRPAYSFFSVIEIGLYELTALVLRKLADQGITPESPAYSELFDTEMAKQKKRVESRLYPRIRPARCVCFYPMSKRRGEQVNWYTLSISERRDLMRGHGRVGHRYHEQVEQVIAGAVGLDDWEWGVTLFADDMLLFKKLIYEMRFDPASARYAEFGPFYVGLRIPADQFSRWLLGT